MFSRFISIILLLSILTACDAVDTMKEGFAHSQAVSSELEKTVGLKSFVGFNWQNGMLVSVNVTFQGIPPNILVSDIAEKSKKAITTEFKQAPKQIIIGFSIDS